MKRQIVVNVRRVAGSTWRRPQRNSNVVSIPSQFEELGFSPHARVLITALPSGEPRILPLSNVRKVLRERGRRVIVDDRRALPILEDYDRNKA